MKRLYGVILFGLALVFIAPLSFVYAGEARNKMKAFKKSI